MRWSRVSFSTKMEMARKLLAGIKRFLSRFKTMDMEKRFIPEVERLTEKVMELKRKQQRLRGELKQTTVELREELNTLGKEVSNGRKMAKLNIEQHLWIAFGIQDKK